VFGAYAQKTVTGTVTDELGEEIIGAGIVVKGTTIRNDTGLLRASPKKENRIKPVVDN
jgi:hypothetical protein